MFVWSWQQFDGIDQNTIGYVLKVLKSYAQAALPYHKPSVLTSGVAVTVTSKVTPWS
jgi:hypothetical protein